MSTTTVTTEKRPWSSTTTGAALNSGKPMSIQGAAAYIQLGRPDSRIRRDGWTLIWEWSPSPGETVVSEYVGAPVSPVDPHAAISDLESVVIDQPLTVEQATHLISALRAAVDGTDPAPSLQAMLAVPAPRKPSGPSMRATCAGCPETLDRFSAAAHEHGHPGHVVTVWDSPTSQLPRTLWAPIAGSN